MAECIGDGGMHVCWWGQSWQKGHSKIRTIRKWVNQGFSRDEFHFVLVKTEMAAFS